MIKRSEVFAILASMIIMAVILSFNNNELKISLFGQSFLIAIIIIGVSVLAKKITARHLDVQADIGIWQWKRYWFSRASEFKTPIPFGILLPILFAFISTGIFKFLAFLEFNAVALPAKAAKKYGARRFSGIMEWDDALIVFYSIIPLLAVAVIAKFLISAAPAFPFAELAKYSLYYSLYNLIPLSQIDGVKLIFGSKPLYVFTLILAGITALIVLL